MATPDNSTSWRVVLDTNVFVAAYLARNPRSPNREVILRWLKGEFVLLIASELIVEIVDKLLEKKVHSKKYCGSLLTFCFLRKALSFTPKILNPSFLMIQMMILFLPAPSKERRSISSLTTHTYCHWGQSTREFTSPSR
jgi:hypothetical protein